jgi:putative ABC transport system ATP-binding protein
LIRLEGVSRRFGSGAARTTALEDVRLEIGSGEFVAVAGPSGSGKTTLLNLIGALDRPSAGRVWVDGRALAELDDEAQARLRLQRLGFVFQRFNLIPVLTAGENVELPLLFRGLPAHERGRRVAGALERVGLAGRRDRRPGALSAGEQQRVAIARAVAGEPALLLADEPTASLDHENGAAVIELLHGLSRERGVTVLYATHDPELIALAGRVVRLRDGRVVEPAA